MVHPNEKFQDPREVDASLLSSITERMKTVAATVGIPEDKITPRTIQEAARRALQAEAKAGNPITEKDLMEGAEDGLLVNALIAQREAEDQVAGMLVAEDGVLVSLQKYRESHQGN